MAGRLPVLAQGRVHRAPSMNGRPRGQQLSEGGPHLPPVPGTGLRVGWHSFPARWTVGAALTPKASGSSQGLPWHPKP